MKTKKIPTLLLRWYQKNKRDLPWRRTRDPYAVWVSEIMLQQTQVDTVVPYYDRWMQRFPTVKKLAAAREEEVVKAWEGLGYYSRARNLRKAAKIVCAQYSGALPSDAETLSQLPGIGPYTLGALLSIAFDQPTPAVDGNVLRVFSRLFAIRQNIKSPKAVATVRNLVTQLYPATHRSEMAQAWMELGALVCLPQNPRCPACPLSRQCAARKQGLVDELPVVHRRPRTQKVETAAVVLQRNGSILLEKRPVGRIMGGLYLFPTVTLPRFHDHPINRQQLRESFKNHLGFALEIQEQLKTLSHSYTIHRATLHVFKASAVKTPCPRPGFHWIPLKNLSKIPFPSVHSKITQFLYP